MSEKKLVDVGPFIDDLMAMKTVYDAIAIGGVIAALKNAPAVDAVEVVHARWEKHKSIPGVCYCSNCKNVFIWEEWLTDGKWNGCPNCMAKMDGGKDDG